MLDLERQMELFGKKSGLVNHKFCDPWSWERIINELDSTQFVCQQLADQGYPQLAAGPLSPIVNFGNDGYALHLVERHKDVRDVLDELQKLNKTFCTKAGLFVSLTRSSKSFPDHRDPLHVWVYQMQGVTNWHVDDGDYVLEPGDILYMPPNILHSARIDGPRASLSFTLGPHDEENHVYVEA